ncbi:unnamed protein product [Mytilus coruscus]|uniref:Uncharacterized protein n=1 Tax=Mytilus coruscus TaxID=42192 RepID=A0A6J8EYD7_MYTCO|nr:unnamed protein product [Mytilus coruscus]
MKFRPVFNGDYSNHMEIQPKYVRLYTMKDASIADSTLGLVTCRKGFPVMYYSNFKGKNHPVALHLSEDEFKEMLQSLFPKLMNKTFTLYTQNQRRKLTEAPFHPQHFKDLKYQGVVIIKIQLQIKAVGDLHILFITSLAEDHVSLVFVLPDQTVLEKTVSKKTSSEIIGKIISHAYVLCNYLPQGISPLLYIFAGNGIYTDELLLQTFSAFITETDSKLVNHLLSNTNWDGLHAEIVNLISTYGGFEVPTKTTVRQSILDLAKITMTVIPCVPISKIKVGMDCYHLLWNGVTEPVIINLMDQYKPTHLKVINLISYTTSDDPTLCSLEEKVKTYFERFIRSLSNKQLLHFLKFWTSSDILCVPRLYVSFNSTQGFNRRPIANTCSATLQISRFYFLPTNL